MNAATPVLIDMHSPNVFYTFLQNCQDPVPHATSEFEPGTFAVRGALGRLNQSRYWIFRDSSLQLWIYGDSIRPILVSDDVSAKVEGTVDRRLCLQRREEIILNIKYHVEPDLIPAVFDFTAASMDDDQGDIGRLICRVLNDAECRRDGWGPNW